MRTPSLAHLTTLAGLLLLSPPAMAQQPDARPDDTAAPAQEAPDAGDELEDLEDLDAMMDEVDEGDDAQGGAEGSGEDGVALEPDEEPDLDRLDTITIQYSPAEIAKTGGSAQLLDEEQLEAAEHDDAHSVLLTLPGVYVRQEDGFGLRPNIGIRGANSERSKKVTLMEDGVLFAPAPYSAPAAYYFPMMTRLTGVEVFKGPGAIAFGPHTVGGAVNLVTRRTPNGHAGGVDAAVGSFPSGKLHAWHGWGNTRFGLLAEGVHLQSAGFKELDGGGPTGFRRSEVMLKGHVNSDPTRRVFHKLEVRATYSNERSHETYLGLSDEDFADAPDRRYAASSLDLMDWWRLGLRADWRLEVGEDFDLTTTAYRNDFSRSWKKFNNFGDGTAAADVLADTTSPRNALFYGVLTGEADSSGEADEIILGTNARDFVSQGVQLRARHRHQGERWSNSLEAGARLHHDQIVREHTEQRYAMAGGELARTEDDEVLATHNEDSATAIAAYLLDQVSFWRLTLTPGVRVEHVLTRRDDLLDDDRDTEGSQTALIPGLGTFVDLYEGLGLLAGVHRGFSPVAPGQGDGVSPETSINYEAGLRFSDERRGALVEAIGFFTDYDNLVGQCTFAAGCDEQDLDDQFNAGRATIWGAEAVAAYTAALGGQRGVPLRATYTYTQTEFATGFDSKNPQFGEVEVGDEMPYVPRHQASMQLGYTGPRVDAHLGATYVGEMREEASQGDEGRRTDPYLLIDALVAYKFLETGRVYAKGDNLLNQRPIASRRPFGARSIRPLFLQLGVKFGW